MKNKFPAREPKAYKGGKVTVKEMYEAFRHVRVARDAAKAGAHRKPKIAA